MSQPGRGDSSGPCQITQLQRMPELKLADVNSLCGFQNEYGRARLSASQPWIHRCQHYGREKPSPGFAFVFVLQWLSLGFVVGGHAVSACFADSVKERLC
ncbi:hypothetical protein SKAU_G00295410 [Synaphobranchus kaupii]|uniref:Uncharacterized protein n=1 Tax=Synaphobranchus kaupii TaxID=118154 RepID=A0A9Q1EUP8_SYNKA|nr:hypothetical protein SKAU_G00295410 [Synaphobranchus kaupii]